MTVTVTVTVTLQRQHWWDQQALREGQYDGDEVHQHWQQRPLAQSHCVPWCRCVYTFFHAFMHSQLQQHCVPWCMCMYTFFHALMHSQLPAARQWHSKNCAGYRWQEPGRHHVWRQLHQDGSLPRVQPRTSTRTTLDRKVHNLSLFLSSQTNVSCGGLIKAIEIYPLTCKQRGFGIGCSYSFGMRC